MTKQQSTIAWQSYIDHTLLKATATQQEIEALCRQAIEHKFFSVCVNPFYVAQASVCLAGEDIAVCSVVNFPLGQIGASNAAREALACVESGASEVDMVLNIGALLDKNYAIVAQEIESVRAACHPYLLKVIIETAYLNPEQIRVATKICVDSGAHFVKTSTGFATRGASVDDIKTIQEELKSLNALDRVGIKASGGVKSLAQARELITAGATRIGSSSAHTW